MLLSSPTILAFSLELTGASRSPVRICCAILLIKLAIFHLTIQQFAYRSSTRGSILLYLWCKGLALDQNRRTFFCCSCNTLSLVLSLYLKFMSQKYSKNFCNSIPWVTGSINFTVWEMWRKKNWTWSHTSSSCIHIRFRQGVEIWISLHHFQCHCSHSHHGLPVKSDWPKTNNDFETHTMASSWKENWSISQTLKLQIQWLHTSIILFLSYWKKKKLCRRKVRTHCCNNLPGLPFVCSCL